MTKRYYCNGFRTDTYNACCREHDNAYGYAGVREADGSLRTRSEADRRMRNCLIQSGLAPFWAWLCWSAVRVFGWIFWKRKSK